MHILYFVDLGEHIWNQNDVLDDKINDEVKNDDLYRIYSMTK